MSVETEPIFTKEQHAAARVLMAQLLTLADGREFDPGVLGVSWVDQTALRLEDGTPVSTRDVVYSAMTLLWSMLVQDALRFNEDSLLPAVSRLGLGLAFCEPTT